MKNLNLFILSMAVIVSIGTYNTFGCEKYVDFSDQDTTNSDIDISDIDFSKVNSCMKKLEINGKTFSVTTEDMLKYRVLRFFYLYNIESDKDDNNIWNEFTRDVEIAKENNDNSMLEIFSEIKDYLLDQIFPSTNTIDKLSERVNELEKQNISHYSSFRSVLKIDNKKFNVSKNIINKYPVLQEFVNKDPFSERYTFEQCKGMTKELQNSIDEFEKNGTYAEADKVKELFLEIRGAIESAVRKLTPDNANQAHEMNEYIRDVLSTEIMERMKTVFDNNK